MFSHMDYEISRRTPTNTESLSQEPKFIIISRSTNYNTATFGLLGSINLASYLYKICMFGISDSHNCMYFFN
jgi:hypothetical protein